MVSSDTRALWAGRTLALLGIIFAAATLRSAVASLSPIIDLVTREVPLSSLVIGILGSMPPVCFAALAVMTPAVVRRFRLEPTMVGVLALIAAGLIVRSAAPSSGIILLGTALACAGLGAGNVLMPALVKKYFPDRVGLVTTIYVTTISFSTFLPPLLAVPVAEGLGWRVSLGGWALVAIMAMVPWLALLGNARRGPAAEIEEPEAALEHRLIRSPMTWAVTVIFATSSINAYSMFAWLPTIARDLAGMDPHEGGTLLAVFGFMGLPAALLVPMLAVRLRSVAPMVWLGGLCIIIGYTGMLFLPSVPMLVWVIIVGSGPLLFPLALTLINKRTRTHVGAIALSGFVQGPGYIVAAPGPILVGLLHEGTGGWIVPLLGLALTGVIVIVAGAVASRPVFIEDGA